MKNLNSLISATLCMIALLLSTGGAKAQKMNAIGIGTISYNLAGSSGIPFDSIHTLSLPHWHCSGTGCSDIFVANQFGLNVPANAHIWGIEVLIDVIIHNLSDSSIRLLKHGVPYGADGALHRHIIAAPDISWGDTSNLWGGSWTPADFNDSTFGVQFRVKDIRSDSVFMWDDANPILIYVTYDTVTPASVAGYSLTVPDIQFYPNPSGGIVNVDFGVTNSNTSIRVVNTLGQVIKEVPNINDQRYELDICNQPTGIYFIEFTSTSGTTCKRLIRE